MFLQQKAQSFHEIMPPESLSSFDLESTVHNQGLKTGKKKN